MKSTIHNMPVWNFEDVRFPPYRFPKTSVEAEIQTIPVDLVSALKEPLENGTLPLGSFEPSQYNQRDLRALVRSSSSEEIQQLLEIARQTIYRLTEFPFVVALTDTRIHELKNPIHAKAILTTLGVLLGRVTRTSSYGDGEVAWDVKPQAITAADAPKTQTVQDIGLHIDSSFREHPEFGFLLGCLHQDQLGGGRSTILPVNDVVRALYNLIGSEAGRNFLERPHVFYVPGPYREDGAPFKKQPIYFHAANRDMGVRYNMDYLLHLQDRLPEKDRASKEDRAILEAWDQEVRRLPGYSVLIPDGSVLIFNNHRILHDRALIRDPNRHMVRVRFHHPGVPHEDFGVPRRD